tara:strand:+ start:1549 stop:1797 length:249 start_codon:yes stop_codon:yes gene_type:complete
MMEDRREAKRKKEGEKKKKRKKRKRGRGRRSGRGRKRKMTDSRAFVRRIGDISEKENTDQQEFEKAHKNQLHIKSRVLAPKK